jgi:hypothetical protein
MAAGRVVADGALLITEELHWPRGQRLQPRPFLLEHGLHLAALGAVDT